MPQTRADIPPAARPNGPPDLPVPLPPPEQTADPPRSRLRPAPEIARVLPVLLPVVLAGLAVTIVAAVSFAGSDQDAEVIGGVLALAAATTIAEAYPVPIEGVGAGRTSLATVFIVAAAALYGWDAATLAGVLGMATVELATRKPPSRVLFNSALYGLAGAAAGGVAAATVGSSLTATALGTVLGAVTFYAVDVGLLSAIMARASAASWPAVLRGFLVDTAAPLGVMASLTVVLVVLWDRSPFAALFLVAPLAALALYERRMNLALERLRELDHLKDEFIAVVSHELRTPLASVYGAAMTLQRQQLDAEARESMLAIVYRESARLARLVDQVLWASRLEAGRADVEVTSIDAVQLARDVVAAAGAQAPEGLTLEVVPSPGTPPVAADLDKLKQVLINLVENAVKYSPAGGRVDVRVEPAPGAVRFTVADEGLGIPAEEHGRIFDKFHRLDPAMTRGVGGTGLGLYIARELVHRMNGRIWLTSAVGRGSSFSVELPRADSAS
jgi:signal transduction histidine kinase